MSYEFGIIGIRKLKQSVLQFIILNSSFIILLASCSTQKQIHQSAKTDILEAKALQTAHVGISIFDPSANKYLYNYQGDHYFVPASNTKIPTCYAAMKYLGDSLVGLKYGFNNDKNVKSSVLVVQPTGDPTLLHSDFKLQPVWTFFASNAERYKESIAILDTIWQENHWGSGWGWSDYDATYMAERNSMPIYGNLIDVKLANSPRKLIIDSINFQTQDILFQTQNRVFDQMLNRNAYLVMDRVLQEKKIKVQITRELNQNIFWPKESTKEFSRINIPFVTRDDEYWKTSYYMTKSLISDTFNYRFGGIYPRVGDSVFAYNCPDCNATSLKIKNWNKIHSQPTDSVLRPMMHRSDNFFAEQMLLMVSNEMLGVMNDAKIIDTILKTDFKDLPQKPRWVDGSGLSRYNLFSPQDFVSILNKMKNEFGMDRIKEIFPTGGEGTISSYYKNETGFIYGKTGTLSGVVAFSGFLYTKKGKLLIFSTLVNNHNNSATDVRKAIEKFLVGVRDKY